MNIYRSSLRHIISSALTSDPWHWEDFKPYWRNAEVLSPPATERTEVLEMSVSDDGEGFDPAVLQNKAGTHDGLFNLRERMSDMGGTCEIQSAPGQGTRITWRVRI